jgi:hypothetical protein
MHPADSHVASSVSVGHTDGSIAPVDDDTVAVPVTAVVLADVDAEDADADDPPAPVVLASQPNEPITSIRQTGARRESGLIVVAHYHYNRSGPIAFTRGGAVLSGAPQESSTR